MKHMLAVLFAVSATSLFAETLAWYHFDEVAPGEKPTSETRFLNAVDPAVAPGRPISQIDWQTKTGDDTHFPLGVSAFPDGFSVLDPVSGDAPVNARALVFSTGKREDTYYGASGVKIENDPASTTGKLTYECFVRFDPSRTPDGMGSNCKRVILAKHKDDNGGIGFKLVYDYWESWGRNLMVYVNSDTVVDASEVYLNDGKWHHVALTFDAADSSVRVYADYVLVGEATGLTVDFSQMASNPLSVGYLEGDASWPRWGGVIDELRISDATLAPQQMLKVQSSSAARPVDKDTAAYQSFSLGDEFTLTLHMRNEANGEGSLGAPSFYSKGNAPTQIPDVPVRQIGTSEGLVENTRAISFTGNAKGWAFEDPSATLIQGDYTAEMFFRTSDEYSSDCYLMAQSDAMVLQLQEEGLRMNWSGPQARGNFCDGKWHHVALVYVQADGKYDLYVDYTYRGSKSSSIDPEKAEKAFRFGGYSANYYDQVHNIDIDEVRITRRALNPDEFIHPSEPDVAWFISGDPNDWAQCWSWSMPTLPNYAKMNFTLDEVCKPDELVAAGILNGLRANEASFHVESTDDKNMGIQLDDEQNRIANGDFTVELTYRMDITSDRSLKANYLFHQNGDQNEWSARLYNGNLDFQQNWGSFAKVARETACDGKWHHVALVQDVVNRRLCAYFDYKLVKCKEDFVLDASKMTSGIWIGCQSYGENFKDGWMDNIRVTRKALKPCEFLTSKHADGPTLAWAYFDNGDGSFAQKYDEAATYSGEATFASRGAGAEVLDAEGNVLRENKGSLRMLSGAASYSRLSLLERTDLTAELFLRAKAIADGTDVLALTGKVKDETPTIWSLRAVNGALKVFAGGTEVADAGTVPASWAHFAVAFDPAADGSSTAVKVYRDHELVDEQSVAGTLAVDGLKDSSLKIGSFDGAVDELRFSKGALGVADMLYRPKAQGLILLIR